MSDQFTCEKCGNKNMFNRDPETVVCDACGHEKSVVPQPTSSDAELVNKLHHYLDMCEYSEGHYFTHEMHKDFLELISHHNEAQRKRVVEVISRIRKKASEGFLHHIYAPDNCKEICDELDQLLLEMKGEE